MTETGKVALFGGAALAASAAAYYFFFYRKSQQSAQAASATIAQTIQALTPPPSKYEGDVIREGNDIRVYVIKDGIKHLFTSPTALQNAGFNFDQVISLPPSIVEAIPTGSDINGLKGLPKKLLM